MEDAAGAAEQGGGAVTPDRLEIALAKARKHLLAQVTPEGFWEGQLSSSALATAVAVSAMVVAGHASDRELIADGCRWLAATQNPDGGWGDTTDSPSNLPTTLLCLASLTLGCHADAALSRAEEFITAQTGETPTSRVQAVSDIYGADRTFAAPILINCALAGLVPWESVAGLPFELAAIPHKLHRLARMQVVSYALPALVAVGVLLHDRNPAANLFVRRLREMTKARALAVVAAMQPECGGFLEAAPLTGFVAMSLAAALGPDHEVVTRCLEFLRGAVREDGSWPIDTNLSVWVTTNAIVALDASGGVPDEVAGKAREWLLGRQLQREHPFTHAAPGGWAWTHLEGGVPDADDTAGALRALATLMVDDPDLFEPVYIRGLKWLVGVRNSDGGWPTFCRGWGRLPFDQSCPDITAHALLALATAADEASAMGRGLRYLQRQQRMDGSWAPLWFGNQYVPERENLVMGTARVLQALAEVQPRGAMARAGMRYLIEAQGQDGGWGGALGGEASVEETARAVVSLSGWPDEQSAAESVRRGTEYLVGRVEDDTWTEAAPIGLYFASLWYAEAMYPVAWTVEALGRASEANHLPSEVSMGNT